MKKIITALVLLLSIITTNAQTTSHKKYPSILWEITGNGLKKPSYLFGTMHISGKIAFHLSDSFYTAIQSVDEVALELNPDYWQRDMMKMDALQYQMNNYLKSGANDYISEKSFQLNDYNDNLVAALTQQPALINSLLYRTYQQQEDFEENTYLDMYIYQTGRKLGKKAGGVEDYYTTEKIIFDAYHKMLEERAKKKNSDDNNAGDRDVDIEKKIQDAYKRGDLDLLDSLQKKESGSPAYDEVFLYKRNEIQANSIDTILKHNALFVGVGAAHLAGSRGVIELLRKKGYKLRPIEMPDRDAQKKDEIDKIKVPVVFRNVQTDDGFISMKLPGTLYKRVQGQSYLSNNEDWQYADMNNGTYYTLTRVRTHAAMLGQTMNDVLKKTDSVLYENIPGKIISKTPITKDGYPGYDIVNKTRRGDVQRYNIIITPFEILVFKMSGVEDYVNGEEANTFFHSISIKKINNGWTNFQTSGGGFAVQMPQTPDIHLSSSDDGLPRWQYEAVDSANGNAYMIWKSSIQNYRFMEEDTFDLSMIEESLKRSDLIDKETSRSFSLQNGYHALSMKFSLKDGGTFFAKAVLRGPHYYLIAARSDQKKFDPSSFFNSFSITNFSYAASKNFSDTMMKFSVQTPVQPELDSMLMNMVSQAYDDELMNGRGYGNATYWPAVKTAFFQSDTTGEAVQVQVTQFPKYFYSKDSSKFWKREVDDNEDDFDGMVIRSKEKIRPSDSCAGYKLIVRDTNTVRQITSYYLLKNNRLFHITFLSDTVNEESPFLKNFMASFQPEPKNFGPSVFENKLNNFFTDFNDKDSSVKKKANDVISEVYFGCAGLPKIISILDTLRFGDDNYFDLKRKFIDELGYIDDSECVSTVEKYMSDLYTKTADTGYFQNEILQSLAKLQTKSAYTTLKSLLLQDPPVFDDNEDYSTLFENFSDSLQLAKNLFPEILQLAAFEDYKEPVNNLLTTMVDSGFLSSKDYSQYYSSIYFDAKIELKKQQLKDEKLLEKENNKDEDNTTDNYRDYDYSSSGNMDDYSVLLAPFYDQYPAIPKFFDRLLQSKDHSAQLDAAILLIRNKKSVPDSVLLSLASDNKYRSLLYSRLAEIKRTDLYPYKYQTQEAMSRSILLNDKSADKFGDLKLAGKEFVSVKNKKGWVYFFKYKTNESDDDWKIGISGIQPEKTTEVSSDNTLTRMTDKKLTTDKPEIDQFKDQLQKLIYSLHDSAKNFFTDENDYSYLLRKYNINNN